MHTKAKMFNVGLTHLFSQYSSVKVSNSFCRLSNFAGVKCDAGVGQLKLSFSLQLSQFNLLHYYLCHILSVQLSPSL